MTEEEKVEELAKQLYIGALSGATDLGSLSYWDRKRAFEDARDICYEAAKAFYGVE